MSGHDDFSAVEIDAWMLLEGVDVDDLDDEFKKSTAHDDALFSYVADFAYSVEYETAYQEWLHQRMDES